MLSDSTTVPKVRLALFDFTVFRMDIPQSIWELRLIRKLQYDCAPSWQLRLVHLSAHKQLAYEVQEYLRLMGIHFLDVTSVEPEDMQKMRDLLDTSDLVYAPSVLKCFPLYTRLRPPPTAKAAVEAVCWFSTSAEPFTLDNYYAFLNAYGS